MSYFDDRATDFGDLGDTVVADNGWFRYVSDNVAWCGWIPSPIFGRLFSLWHRLFRTGRHRDLRSKR